MTNEDRCPNHLPGLTEGCERCDPKGFAAALKDGPQVRNRKTNQTNTITPNPDKRGAPVIGAEDGAKTVRDLYQE